MSVTHNVVLNVDKDKVRLDQRVHVRCGDVSSQVVKCALQSGGAAWTPATGSTAKLEILKPDGTWTVTNASISGSNVSGTVPAAAMSAPGECKRAYFRIISGTKEDTTEDFYLYVYPNATQDAIESRPYSDQLDELIAAADQELQDIIDEVRDIRTGYSGTAYATAGAAVRAGDSEMSRNQTYLGYGSIQFQIDEGQTHSSRKDRISLHIEQGEEFVVNVTRAYGPGVKVFVYDSEDVAHEVANVTANGTDVTLVSPVTAEKVGLFMGASTGDQTVTALVMRADSVLNQVSELQEQAEGAGSSVVLDEYSGGLLWWIIGSWNASTGAATSTAGWARTRNMLPPGTVRIYSPSGWFLRLYAFDKETNSFVGLAMKDGTMKPYEEGDEIVQEHSIETQQFMMKHQNCGFYPVVYNGTGQAVTEAEAMDAMKIVIGPKALHPRRDRGFLPSFDNGTVTSFSNAQCIRSCRIPVESGDMLKVRIAVPPYNAEKRAYYDFGWTTYDNGFNELRLGVIARTNSREHIIIQPGEEYAAITVGVFYADGSGAPTLRRHMPEYGDISIEYIGGGFRANEQIETRRGPASILHRGFSGPGLAPEETVAAYLAARRAGSIYADCDLVMTRDGVPVLLHDKTINRTARDANGNAPSETMNAADYDYSTLAAYDYGVWKGALFAGEKLLTFDEFLDMCYDFGMTPSVEIKDTVAFTDDDIAGICQSVVEHGFANSCLFNSSNHNYLMKAAALLPKCGFMFNTASVTNSYLSKLSQLKTVANWVIAGLKDTAATAAATTSVLEAGVEVGIWTVNDCITLDALPKCANYIWSNDFLASEKLAEMAASERVFR